MQADTQEGLFLVIPFRELKITFSPEKIVSCH